MKHSLFIRFLKAVKNLIFDANFFIRVLHKNLPSIYPAIEPTTTAPHIVISHTQGYIDENSFYESHYKSQLRNKASIEVAIGINVLKTKIVNIVIPDSYG